MAFEDAQHGAPQTSRIRELLLYSLQFLLPCFRRRLICKGYLATLAKPHSKVSRLGWIVRLAVNDPTIVVRRCASVSAAAEHRPLPPSASSLGHPRRNCPRPIPERLPQTVPSDSG